MSDAPLYPPSGPPNESISIPSRSDSGIPAPQGVMALVFTDLEGSSALSLQHGKAFEAQRETHFDLLRGPLDTHYGFEVETAGDSLFAVFSSPRAAALWALDARRALENHAWPSEIGALRVRFGIHVGEPFISRDSKTGMPTFRGPATNCAARVMGAANGGQILLSQSAHAAIEGENSALQCRDLGAHRLKGIGCETLFQLDEPGERREFGPLQTLSVRRHNLPLPPSPFIGREEEIEPIRALLLEPKNRLLSLCAFGGMGKTRLALHLSETLVENFSDGIWWVTLEEARSEGAMIAAIAEALPLENDAKRALLDQISEFLSGKNLLLVLDNTEQIEDAPRVVASLLGSASRFQILATTRHALGLRGEVVREIPPLSQVDGARFFTERAIALGALLEPSDPIVGQIVARVEGVPLALELAASHARVLGLKQILKRLDDQLQLLRASLPDLPARQRALRATMDWSFQMLQPSEKLLFQSLSIFAGGFDLEDVEAICPELDVFFDLNELHRRSLVRALPHPVRDGENRYAMLESVRAYAAAKMRETDNNERLAERHARHFNQKFAQWSEDLRGPNETRALCEAELDFDNARAGLRFWNRDSTRSQGASLGLELGRMLARTGRLEEASLRLHNALEWLAVGESEKQNSSLRAELLLETAGISFDLFNWDKATSHALQAEAIFAALGSDEGRVQCLNVRGLVELRKARQPETQQESIQAARELLLEAQRLSADTLRAIVANNLGLVELQAQNFAEARAHWFEAERISRAHSYERGLAEALTNLGVLAQEEGDWNAAQKNYRAALELEIKMHGQIGVARALSNLGEIGVLREDFGAAAPILAAGTLLFERANSPHKGYTQSWLDRACERVGENSSELKARFSQWPLEKLGAIGLGQTVC